MACCKELANTGLQQTRPSLSLGTSPLKPLRGVRCQDGAHRVRHWFCTERNGFSLGDARPVDVRAGLQVVPRAVDESRAEAVLGMSSGAEMKPLRC
jgi:hypothetical protein